LPEHILTAEQHNNNQYKDEHEKNETETINKRSTYYKSTMLTAQFFIVSDWGCGERGMPPRE